MSILSVMRQGPPELEISQDDLNLILGGNAVRLYNLRTPGGLTRMFKSVD